jgi:hypothetical protein
MTKNFALIVILIVILTSTFLQSTVLARINPDLCRERVAELEKHSELGKRFSAEIKKAQENMETYLGKSFKEDGLYTFSFRLKNNSSHPVKKDFLQSEKVFNKILTQFLGENSKEKDFDIKTGAFSGIVRIQLTLRWFVTLSVLLAKYDDPPVTDVGFYIQDTPLFKTFEAFDDMIKEKTGVRPTSNQYINERTKIKSDLGVI